MRVVEVIIDVCTLCHLFGPFADTNRVLNRTLCGQSSRDGKQSYGDLLDGADVYRDESFNSITGLNGSGKSNILDAICFVLGITNMTTVRAQNLQVDTSSAQTATQC